ncbi:MAG: hypothetical protein LBK58_11620 [Prevotellaceae bacterium]|jgi:hypothetical protein|nr:hypothetical protein [Prevotellaceae bacterium]
MKSTNFDFFSFWVKTAYHRLGRRLKSQSAYGEDAFHDSFIDVYLYIRNGHAVDNESMADDLFHAFYRENTKKYLSVSMRYAAYKTDILEFIVNENANRSGYSTGDGDEVDYRAACKEVKQILSCYPKEESSLFLLYFNTPDMTVRKMSIYSGKKPDELYRKLKAIKNDILNQVKLKEYETCTETEKF